MDQALSPAAARAAAAKGRSSQIPDFRALLGPAAWRRLPSAVQQRFAAHATESAAATVYRGTMQVRASLLGICLAHLCRLIGTPVVPFVHEEVPVAVRVFDREDRSGTVWERRYEFPGRTPVVVSSVKRVEADGTLVEALGAGLRMRLRVFESDGDLHFLSTGYFFQLGRWRIPLPAWSLPGPTHVVHHDQGNGRFRFTMHTRHRRCGELYWQSGRFS
jgi:Domain of unknown function (DUF4166)